MLATYLGVRTRFYDERVLAATAAGIRQVVIVAAGFDSRAVRLGLPADTTVYEVDTEPVLQFKEAVMDAARLAPRGGRQPVAADLRAPGCKWLRSPPTHHVAHRGLFVYLSPEDSDRLIETVTRLSTHGSRLALEYFDSTPRQDDVATVDETESAVIGRIVNFFQDGPALPPAPRLEAPPWLEAHGWEPDVTTVADEMRLPGGRCTARVDQTAPSANGLALSDNMLHLSLANMSPYSKMVDAWLRSVHRKSGRPRN